MNMRALFRRMIRPEPDRLDAERRAPEVVEAEPVAEDADDGSEHEVVETREQIAARQHWDERLWHRRRW